MKADYRYKTITRHEWVIRGNWITATDVAQAINAAAQHRWERTQIDHSTDGIRVEPYDDDIIVWYTIEVTE